MTRPDAAKLLGGHATGTLTEAERKALYAAALEDQALFDALMDEEALRELLADPRARAEVLAALAQAPALAPPKVAPLWRRPGVLGAAAGVLMASLAGLTWLRNPQAPPPARQERPSPKVLSLAEAAEAPPSPAEPKAARRKAAPRPAAEPPAAAVAAPAPMPTPTSAPMPAPMPATVQENRYHRMEKAASPPPDAGSLPGGIPGGVIGGVAGGVVGGVVGGAVGRPQDQAQAQVQAQARDQAQGQVQKRAPEAAAVTAVVAETAPAPPVWTLAPQADGTTLVTVTAPPEAQVWLLRRGDHGVEVLRDRAAALKEAREAPRRYQVRLRAGDALDLYVLAHPVADPAKLPETGPLAGFRARIFPAGK